MSHQKQRMNRRKGRRGSYFIEFSLAFFPMFVLIMGIIDFALPMYVRSAFTNAVREGVRYGSTFRYMSGKNHVESIQSIVVRNSGGFLDDTNGTAYVKVRFYEPGNFAEVTSGVKNADGNIVEVSIENYSWHWIAPMWRTANPLLFNIRAAERLETLPRSATRPAAP